MPTILYNDGFQTPRRTEIDPVGETDPGFRRARVREVEQAGYLNTDRFTTDATDYSRASLFGASQSVR